MVGADATPLLACERQPLYISTTLFGAGLCANTVKTVACACTMASAISAHVAAPSPHHHSQHHLAIPSHHHHRQRTSQTHHHHHPATHHSTTTHRSTASTTTPPVHAPRPHPHSYHNSPHRNGAGVMFRIQHLIHAPCLWLQPRLVFRITAMCLAMPRAHVVVNVTSRTASVHQLDYHLCRCL